MRTYVIRDSGYKHIFLSSYQKNPAFWSTMELKNGEGFDVNKVKDMAEVCLC